MRKPTATVNASSRDAWQDAFPKDEAQRAAKFLAKTWDDLARQRPKIFQLSRRENKITEVIGVYLKKLSGESRLTGFWSYEEQSGNLDESVEDDSTVIKRIRKDITYSSNADNKRIELIFEFKKLKATNDSCKTYRGEDGMRRFVDGNYATGLPLALMVGMIIGDLKSCQDMLHNSILSTAGKTELRMVPHSNGKLILTPSKIFPELAAFDTEHNRPQHLAPQHGTMLLSHMFLLMPGTR